MSTRAAAPAAAIRLRCVAGAILLLLLHAPPSSTDAWVLGVPPPAARSPASTCCTTSSSSTSSRRAGKVALCSSHDADDAPAGQGQGQQRQPPNAVRASLKYIGPYPCLALRFPRLATPSQRSRNVTGISLDFVLDTAANTNTINGQVAQQLGLEVVGEALPGVGAAGSIGGGDTYLLGDCQLECPPAAAASAAADADAAADRADAGEEEFIFMQGLTASALPVASPAAAGLLGLYFFNCFQGGVMFEWGSNDIDSSSSNDSASSAALASTLPSVTFFVDRERMGHALDGLERAPIRPLPVSALPSIDVVINGKTIPALLDTGSPITVLNAEAARLAGVTTTMEDGSSSSNNNNNINPFAKLAKNFQSAQAAARGEVLLIAGVSGERVELVRSKGAVECGVAAGDGGGGAVVDIGKHLIYVGDLPGLAALGGLGGDGAPPAAVLGMDVLRTRQRMVYRPDEVFL
jgi:hypothetical protein